MALIERALRMGEAKKFREFEQRVARISTSSPRWSSEDAELRQSADALRERRETGNP